MKLGIFAKTFSRPTLEGILDAVKESGLEAVQINMSCAGLPSMPDAIEPELARRIGDAVRERGLRMAAVSGTFNMIHPDVAKRIEGLRRLEVIAQAAALMGTHLITLCTGTRDVNDMWKGHPDNLASEAWHDLCGVMEKALLIAEHHQVDLGVEPEIHNVVDSAVKARHLLDQMKSPRLKIVLDPANLYRAGELPDKTGILEQAFDLLGPDLAMAHAKDLDLQGKPVAAGKGAVDFPKFIGLLRQSGFEGPLVAHGLTEEEVPSVMQFLHQVMR